MFKRSIYPEESRILITYVTLDISYDDNKKVRIRKIHKNIKTKEFKKSKYLIENDETYIYDNQIVLDMFSVCKCEPHNIFTIRSLKPENEEFKTQFIEFSKYGTDFFRIEKYYPTPFLDWTNLRIDIYVSMKNPDEQLNDSLCNTIHQLCKKYLDTSVVITGKDTIICRIYDCSYSENILKKFIEDFIITTEQDINKNLKEKKVKKDISFTSR